MIADLAAEEAVLGCVALSDKYLPLFHEAGLRSEHFYRHADLYRHLLKVADDGTPVDAVTVPELDRYSGAAPAISNWEAYARKIIDKHRWRTRYAAGVAMMQAATDEDETHAAEAEAMLITPEESDRVFRLDRLQQLMWDRMEAEGTPGWQMPFFTQRLTPGSVWLWGAHTSHGKTVWVDQIARELRAQKATVWAWINEMTAEERVCRHVSATTGIDLERVLLNDLTGAEKGEALKAVASMPFQIVECPGWSAETIARDIRLRRPDVAIIDILHRIPYETERDLSRISQVLGNAAKLARCVIVATVHLNRARIQTADRPQPTLADIKGASAFEQDADGVGMVWRKDDEVSGRPTPDGMIYTLKVRMGKFSGVEVYLDGARATFHRS